MSQSDEYGKPIEVDTRAIARNPSPSEPENEPPSEEPPDNHSAANSNGAEKSFWSWAVAINAIWIILAIGATFFRWEAGAIIALLNICYNVLSLQTVGPTELGALLFFGRPLHALTSGLNYVPFGVCSIERETRLIIQEQYPGDPENVWKGDEESRPANKMSPIRVTHKGSSIDGSDSLDRRMTTEVSIIVRFRIMNYIIFLTTIASIKEAKRQIRDTIVAKVREELALKTPAQTLEGLKKINEALLEHIIGLVQGWGLKVEDVRLEEVDLGKTVNTALRNVPAAELAKQKTVLEASAEKIRLTDVGAGEANAIEARLKAEAAGMAEKARVLHLEGDAVLSMETLGSALKEAKHTVLSGDNALAQLITMGQKVIEGNKSNETQGGE